MRRIAFADPPYLGCAKKHYSDHPDHAVFDSIDGHRTLIEKLEQEFDGFVYCLSSVTLGDLLPLFTVDTRVLSWVKPFASFKPGVNPAYAWEPMIVSIDKKRGRDLPTIRDWFSCNITLKKGLTGAKPLGVCQWLLEVMYVEEGDQVVDLFPGTGIMAEAVNLAGAEYVAETNAFQNQE